jgi:hypothetical protein
MPMPVLCVCDHLCACARARLCICRRLCDRLCGRTCLCDRNRSVAVVCNVIGDVIEDVIVTVNAVVDVDLGISWRPWPWL